MGEAITRSGHILAPGPNPAALTATNHWFGLTRSPLPIGGCPVQRTGRPLRRESTSGILLRMSQSLESNTPETGVFNLGPLDGQEHSIKSDTDELRVAMTDGQRHRYLRTNQVQRLPDGRSAVVFVWAGRSYGLR
jgi:hypothetical protein